MKLKILLLAGLTTLSASAFAGRNSTPDLRNAVALSCKSAGLGYFNLINLDGDAAYVSSRKTPSLSLSRLMTLLVLSIVINQDINLNWSSRKL